MPVDSVGVERCLGSADTDVGSTVVATSVAFAEVVGFDLGGVAAEGLPVDLVQVVGLKHNRAHNTSAGSSLQCHLDSTEKEVVRSLDGGSIALLGDGESGTIAAVAN